MKKWREPYVTITKMAFDTLQAQRKASLQIYHRHPEKNQVNRQSFQKI